MENESTLSSEALIELLTLTVDVDVDKTRRWYNKDGKLHRVYGAAVEFANGNKSYYFNGYRHRADGPAFIWSDGYPEYWINGKQVDPF